MSKWLIRIHSKENSGYTVLFKLTITQNGKKKKDKETEHCSQVVCTTAPYSRDLWLKCQLRDQVILTEICHSLSQSLPENSGMLTYVRPWMLPSTPFPTVLSSYHWHCILLPTDIIITNKQQWRYLISLNFPCFLTQFLTITVNKTKYTNIRQSKQGLSLKFMNYFQNCTLSSNNISMYTSKDSCCVWH